MIDNIVVTNHLGEALTIELRSPEKSGLIINSIEGLDPPKADISMTKMIGKNGSKFNSARVNERNIVLTFNFMEKPDVETVRQLTYKYFPLGEKINIKVNTTNRNVQTDGYVESNEADIFSNQTSTTISVLCEDSFLRDVNTGIAPFSSVTPLFEFPFSNESLVASLIVMSEVLEQTEKTVLYLGDAPTGIILHVHASGPASDLVFTHSWTLETLYVDSDILIDLTGADISLGDDIYISTIKGNKYAKLIRGGIEYNILNALGPNPTWFQLKRGDNVFAYDALSGLSNLQFRILYDLLYEGI